MFAQVNVVEAAKGMVIDNQPQPTFSENAASVILIVVTLAFVSLPAMIAFFRGHPHFLPICVLMVAMPGIGWLAALVWSVSTFGETEFEMPKKVRKPTPYDEYPIIRPSEFRR